MQYKKEAMRDSILKAAEDEFFERGYEGASIRNICERAGTSVGNLYRYFENRESLFDAIVGDVFREIRYIIEEQAFDSPELGSIKDIAAHIGDKLFQNYRSSEKKFLILLDRSEGSGYGDVKAEFARILTSRINKETFGGADTPEATFMSNMLANGALEAIYNIMRGGYSDEDMKMLFEKVLMFYYYDLRHKVEDLTSGDGAV